MLAETILLCVCLMTCASLLAYVAAKLVEYQTRSDRNDR